MTIPMPRFIYSGLFFLAALSIRPAMAQKTGNERLDVEAGFNFGATFFLGDLGGKPGNASHSFSDINLPGTKFQKGLTVTLHPNEWLGYRLGAQLTAVGASDAYIVDNNLTQSPRKNRNLDFKSNIWEVYTAIELYPLMLMQRYDADYIPRLRPYIFAGVGIFHFNPQGSITDENGNTTWHYLAPLHTEGQDFPEYPNRKTYALTQLNMPMGGGLKYLLSDKVNVGLEILNRKTFTDYIDDVSTNFIDPNLFTKYLSASDALIATEINDKSILNTGLAAEQQRGNAKHTDSYFSILLKVGIKLYGNFDNEYDKHAAKKISCSPGF